MPEVGVATLLEDYSQLTPATGIGVIGGVGYTPKMLRNQIKEIKEALKNKDAPWGVDLLLPAVGGTARKTNKDYTGGRLHELIDIIIEEKVCMMSLRSRHKLTSAFFVQAHLFVCAVGVPAKEVVDKLHKAKIPVMNMVGAPKHVKKALDVGVDLICAQGGEGESSSDTAS